MKTILLSFLLLGCYSSFNSTENNASTAENNSNTAEDNTNFTKNTTNDLVEIAPDFFVEESLVNSEKTKKIHEVFRRLKAAKGDNRSRKPELHLVETTGRGIAVAYQLSGVIKLEEKGFDLCASFGADADNALAILLAHELIHIYEKHSWENLFAWEYSHTSLKSAIKNEQKKDEIQADYLGGVLAYQAGYKVFGVMPQFLDKVYETYRLKDENMTDYPGLEERKLFAVESEDKFKYFINLFEMANLLTIKGEYDNALIYYDQVLRDFQSREMYNNIGVVSLQAALQHFNSKTNQFAYPIELDVVSRMDKAGKDGVDLEYRERKLLDAIHYFANAIHLDPQYPIALLNKGCANALLGIARPAMSGLEWKDASVSAERAIIMSEGKPEWVSTLSDGHVLLGILAGLEKDTTEAVRLFDQALFINKNNLLAEANKSVLGFGTSPFASTGELGEMHEKIDNIAIEEMKFGDEQLQYSHGISESDSLFLWRKNYPHSYVLVNQHNKMVAGEAKTFYYIFHQTEQGYSGETTKGISLKNGTYQSIKDKYGKPHGQFPLGNGTLLHYEYENQELIFQLGPDGRLLRWFIYKAFS